MKFSLLTILILTVIFNLSAQKVDYDNASKSFIGFNLGGTWNTTDVKYKLGAGWGITLGRSFNYNYGKIVSFDVRARYLSGNWYGRDTSSSSLADYSLPNGALSAYTTQGNIVHNFKTKTRRLALELALHLNGITERTGLDPYVFGGIGFTFNRTYGNLLKSDSLSIYQYPGDLNSLDDTYESVLDRYDTSKFMVNAMPSLGFGLGYNIGKNTTIGIEHKTTFTQKDDFDGFESQSPRSKNDLYHYTSLYVQFRLNTKPSEGNLPSSANPVVSCPKPTIRLNPNTSNFVSTSPQFSIDASISNVSSMSNITLLNSLNYQVPFTYNSFSNQFNSTVILVPGINTFTLTATNECGVTQKVITIQYNDCISPSLSFINPSSARSIVRESNFTFSASINGIQSNQGILVYQNGALLNNISFNPSTNILQANVTLQLGLNEFIVTLTNNCGTISSNTSVTYENCTKPSLSFINPSSARSIVRESNFTLSASINGIPSNKGILVYQNGALLNNINFNPSTNILQANITLQLGLNEFIVTLTNNCGSTSSSTSVTYENCTKPTITATNPKNNSTVTLVALNFKAKIENITSKENITAKLNGNSVSATYNSSTKMADLNLQLIPGKNTISITASTSCGSASETVIINFDDCKAPTITINGRNTTLASTSYIFTANISNMNSKEGITVTQNGTPINFTFTNGQITSNINLQVGENTLMVNAVKSCGRDSKTLLITYKKPKPKVEPSEKKEEEKEIKTPESTPKGKGGGK